jgi:hypothetical protein
MRKGINGIFDTLSDVTAELVQARKDAGLPPSITLDRLRAEILEDQDEFNRPVADEELAEIQAQMDGEREDRKAAQAAVPSAPTLTLVRSS